VNIGLIGPGDIGAVIVKKLRDAGYPVKMANSKGPDSLRELAAKTGAIPVSVEEVVQDVDILFLVLPQKAFPVLPKGLLNKAKKETIVIDVGNYYPWRDGRIDEIESGLTESAWVEKQIRRPVFKVLNSIARRLWPGRDALREAETVLLFRSPETIPRRKKSSLNLLIELDSIRLTREQSLSRGDNNLDLPFTASIRRKKNFSSC